MTLGRFFAVWVLLVNGAVAGALAAALIFGIRPITVLDALVIIALVVGLVGAVAIVLEKPLRDTMEKPADLDSDEIASKTVGAAPVRFGAAGDQRPTPIRVVSSQGELPVAADDLDAFLPERPQHQRK